MIITGHGAVKPIIDVEATIRYSLRDEPTEGHHRQQAR